MNMPTPQELDQAIDTLQRVRATLYPWPVTLPPAFTILPDSEPAAEPLPVAPELRESRPLKRCGCPVAFIMCNCDEPEVP